MVAPVPIDDRAARLDEPQPWWQRKRVLLPVGVIALAAAAVALRGDPESAEIAADAVVADGGLEDEIDPLVGSAGQGGQASDRVDPSTTEGSTRSETVTTAVSTTTPTTKASTSSPPTTRVASTTATTARPTTASTAAPTTVATTAPTTVTTQPATTAPPTTAPTTTAADCHPAYLPCLPNLPGDAINCGDLAPNQKPVTVKNPAVDPYGLDSDGDGVGCESG